MPARNDLIWCYSHSCCIECKTTTIKHAGKWLCTRCYDKKRQLTSRRRISQDKTHTVWREKNKGKIYCKRQVNITKRAIKKVLKNSISQVDKQKERTKKAWIRDKEIILLLNKMKRRIKKVLRNPISQVDKQKQKEIEKVKKAEIRDKERERIRKVQIRDKEVISLLNKVKRRIKSWLPCLKMWLNEKYVYFPFSWLEKPAVYNGNWYEIRKEDQKTFLLLKKHYEKKLW